MTNEEQQELILLNVILSDEFIWDRLKSQKDETLEVMVNRHIVLLDKVINNYKLPTTSLPTP